MDTDYKNLSEGYHERAALVDGCSSHLSGIRYPGPSVLLERFNPEAKFSREANDD